MNNYATVIEETYNEITQAIMKIQLNLEEFFLDKVQYNQIKEDLVRKSYNYHLDKNFNYKKYAESMLEDVFDLNDVDEIPLIPSSFFKKPDINLLSTERTNIIKQCQSSGTSGSISMVPRDETTLTNFLGSISSTFPSFFDIERAGNQKGFVLGPSTEEAGDLWFSYVISCISLMMQTECLEKKGILDLNIAKFKIEEAIHDGNSIVLIGPPYRILELANLLTHDQKWPNFPEKSYIISAGGWKNKERESINDAAYRKAVMENFKITDGSAIRDMFNMVELNTVLPECEYHNKHVPPWLEVIIRDPTTNERVKNGETGIISFLDASAMSYPGFILSEDIGYLTEDTCQCGRIGPVLKIVRRMNNIESRGCALKMATDYKTSSKAMPRFHTSIYRAD